MVNTLKRFGFSGDIPAIPSLALGVKEVSVKELTEAYSILAKSGKQVHQQLLQK